VYQAKKACRMLAGKCYFKTPTGRRFWCTDRKDTGCEVKPVSWIELRPSGLIGKFYNDSRIDDIIVVYEFKQTSEPEKMLLTQKRYDEQRLVVHSTTSTVS
jgi:hypothetical protein